MVASTLMVVSSHGIRTKLARDRRVSVQLLGVSETDLEDVLA